MEFLAQATQRSELREGMGSTIFLGLFVIAVIIVAIWWLRR